MIFSNDKAIYLQMADRLCDEILSGKYGDDDRIPSVREYATEHGFIDILGKDSEGNLMILELKARKAGIAAVKQIRRYLSDFENRENKEIKGKTGEKQKIRGLLVAPSIGDDALELLEEEGIEFVAVEPPRELKKDKKVTLDAFG